MSIMKYPLLSTNVSPNTKRMILYVFTNYSFKKMLRQNIKIDNAII